MEKKKFSDLLVSVKPNTFMSLAFAIIFVVGILGEVFSWPVWWPGLGRKIIGCVVFVSGWALHWYCHRFHQKAHEVADHIQNVVTSGPFSTTRHPMYLGMILMYFGLAIGWGIIWMLIPAALSSALVLMTALKEEAFLSAKLGPQYLEYMKKVPWRFIPKVF